MRIYHALPFTRPKKARKDLHLPSKCFVVRIHFSRCARSRFIRVFVHLINVVYRCRSYIYISQSFDMTIFVQKIPGSIVPLLHPLLFSPPSFAPLCEQSREITERWILSISFIYIARLRRRDIDAVPCFLSLSR